jgi:hypothetical protein
MQTTKRAPASRKRKGLSRQGCCLSSAFGVFCRHLDGGAGFRGRPALRFSFSLPARLIENALYKGSFLPATVKSPVSIAFEKK